MDCADPAQEASGEHFFLTVFIELYIFPGGRISSWLDTHSCTILAKNLAASCPCPKNFPETKLKSNETVSSAEISRQPNRS